MSEGEAAEASVVLTSDGSNLVAPEGLKPKLGSSDRVVGEIQVSGQSESASFAVTVSDKSGDPDIWVSADGETFEDVSSENSFDVVDGGEVYVVADEESEGEVTFSSEVFAAGHTSSIITPMVGEAWRPDGAPGDSDHYQTFMIVQPYDVEDADSATIAWSPEEEDTPPEDCETPPGDESTPPGDDDCVTPPSDDCTTEPPGDGDGSTPPGDDCETPGTPDDGGSTPPAGDDGSTPPAGDASTPPGNGGDNGNGNGNGNGGNGNGSTNGQPTGTSLAKTGASVGALVLLAAGVIGSGVMMRKRAQHS